MPHSCSPAALGLVHCDCGAGGDVTNLVDTTEMYLRTILDLEEEGIVPLRARISERLGHSGPTVSQTIARMERDGLVVVAPDRRLVLTEEGRLKAVRVLRKHRLAEGLLSQVIGLDIARVHEEACRWEHVMSEEAEQRIFELLGRPGFSPYGTPIPGLEEFGGASSGSFLDGVVNLVEASARGRGEELTVRRFGEPVQADVETMLLLREAGVLPGARIRVEESGERFSVFAGDASEGVTIPLPLAEHVYVDA